MTDDQFRQLCNTFGFAPSRALRELIDCAIGQAKLAKPDLFHCPQCGGPADNGHDRSIPPSPYWCTKCMADPVQEPVAKVELMLTGGNAGLATRIVEIDDHLRERLHPGQLLYTAPPQRKPLTEEEIKQLLFESAGMTVTFSAVDLSLARAIERAHGIT